MVKMAQNDTDKNDQINGQLSTHVTVQINSSPSPSVTSQLTPTIGTGQLTFPTITLSDLSLDIRTKSIEATLVPLVEQITTLVNAREHPIKSEKQLRAIVRVGVAVNLAVERFVAVGEAMADDNPEIRAEMVDACKETRASGTLIEQLCDCGPDESGQFRSYADKSAMVRAARALLSSVTRVLLIADTVVVKQLVTAKDRVSISLNRLENVANFTEFVKAFSQFGSEMVELAHLTGDRQNDLKDERRRAQMSSARQILERSTMLLLTSSKACLRHPDCDTARENRDTVFLTMRKAIDLIHLVLKDGVIPHLAASAASYESTSRRNTRHGHVSRYQNYQQQCQQETEWSLQQWEQIDTAHNAIKRFQDFIEMSRMTMISVNSRERLSCALDKVVDHLTTFTDSAYTSHEHRETILLLCDRTKLQLNTMLRIGVSLDEAGSSTPTEDFESSVAQTLHASNELKQQLQDTAMDQSDELFKHHVPGDLLNRLKNAAISGHHDRLDEYGQQFSEHVEHVQEVCKLLHHVSITDALQVSSKNTESSIAAFGPQVLAASQTLLVHPNSKIAKENLEVFGDSWITLYNDVAQFARECSELCRSGHERSAFYYSLPKATKHGATPKTPAVQQQLPGVSTQTQSQTEMPNIQKSVKISEENPEVAPEAEGTDPEKWTQEEDNDIVRKAKSMSSMAYSMYQFTRGEGELKTTQDLFTQAEFFADEANKLYKIVRHVTYQIPSGQPKKELLDNLDKVPTFVQQLQFAVKQNTVGKAATFTKVDNVIQETKNLMGVISKVVSNSMNCAEKYSLDMQGALARGRSRTLSPSMGRGEGDDYYFDGGGGLSKSQMNQSESDI